MYSSLSFSLFVLKSDELRWEKMMQRWPSITEDTDARDSGFSCVSSLLSCVTLCNPMDCSLPGPSIHGIFQATVLEWVAISFSRGSSWPGDRTWVSHIAGRCSTLWATREARRQHKGEQNKTVMLGEWPGRWSDPVPSLSDQRCSLKLVRVWWWQYQGGQGWTLGS